MVHDRRIDGEVHVFGNAGGLFMSAMTWYDHQTESIWSQPWSRAISGHYHQTELVLLPSQLTTWSAWRSVHPDTRLMVNGLELTLESGRDFDPLFVVGLLLDGTARAYYFHDLQAHGLANDWIGERPIIVWSNGATAFAYLRLVGTQQLTFADVEGEIVDLETGTSWDLLRGRGVAGPLAGEVLQTIPNASAFDWAWLDFYPESTFWEPAGSSPLSFSANNR